MVKAQVTADRPCIGCGVPTRSLKQLCRHCQPRNPKRPERPCPRCGINTTAKKGVCRPCSSQPPAARRDRSWADDAVCRKVAGAAELLFSTRPEDIAEAKVMCRFCPVAVACLMDALATESGDYYRHGIYGGKTPAERAQMGRAAA